MMHPDARKIKVLKRAVIYIRYSSHKQHGNYSVEYQHDECMEYLERKGYKFIKQYIDEAQSGKKTAGREAFHQMIRDGEAGKFDVIVVFSFSRSFRNTRDALNYIMDNRIKNYPHQSAARRSTNYIKLEVKKNEKFRYIARIRFPVCVCAEPGKR